MAFWFSSCWIYLWIFVQSTNLSADSASPPHYTIHRTQVSFDQARGACSPGGLATLATEQEVTTVLGLIAKLLLPQSEFAFWVGLKKDKNQCVVPSSPLRGFSWIEDTGEDSPVIPWAKEPQDTCTTVRCVVLQVKRDGLSVTSWGLSPVTCKESSVHQFICKLRDGQTRLMSEDGMSTIKPTSLEPVTREVKPAELEPPETESKPPMREPGTDLNFKAEPDPGPDSGSVVVSNLCRRPVIPRARALRLDPNNSSRIQVECWSDYRLDLHCWGRPDVWRLWDESPANLTVLCAPCRDGFRKDASGNCVDFDECTGAPCRHTCVNTEGSYMCVCLDQDGRHQDEGSPACTPTVTIDDRASVWGIWIPVLVAVATLLVLVVVVAVTVKCCLMRNARKRALKNEDNQA
ncbi:C-type lectin domain family 14 member A [Hippoglossus stenolepis]|uniref:C-type lectin domain family 14 member A n=1 Tax=Hippoglossus stenolepis TaxID=195615 RepID=UPI00159C3328|nr:C-type lectin domain family 14 member A [Hippoglossus stenolepis]